MRFPNTMDYISRENLRRFGQRFGFWLFLGVLILLVVLMIIFIKPTPGAPVAGPTPVQKLVFGPDMSVNAQVERSNGVMACPNGIIVGLDPVSGLYVFSGGGTSGKWVGNLAPGVTPAEFCSGVR